MRELTFKGYLQQQLCELSGCKSKSLYKFSKIAKSNARLRNVLTVYLHFFVQDNLKNQLCKKYTFLASSCAHYDDSLSEYKTIYENYLYKKNKKANEGKNKAVMQKRILEMQAEKEISNYRIYTSLNLNPGNINDFLKSGNVNKVGLNTARKILSFVNEY